MSASGDSARVVSIGILVGGRTPANRAWVTALHQLMLDVATLREGAVADVNVNGEFHVPGNHLVPDFEGVRTGAFRRADSLLKVQVALPASAQDDPRAALLTSLSKSIDAFEAWAAKRRRDAGVSDLRQLIDRLHGSGP
ncbi:hypothetical protein [Cellulomonas alba]|uniref:Uncharacterized protein n=1 Tax=Cellulomonas alba TaxID=3053467 RepID=A0ABT7SIF4_9CELL|nr:hypothetical protein [Cellulomonas alba]MDM7855844.1 hypothetical protein [Cellulomonas alba]